MRNWTVEATWYTGERITTTHDEKDAREYAAHLANNPRIESVAASPL